MTSRLRLPLPLLLALRTHLGRHRTPSLIVLFAVAASVTLATALEMSTSSMEEELAGTAANLAGATDIEIVGGTLGVSDKLVAEVARVTGVRIAAPLVVANMRVSRGDGRLGSIHVLGVDLAEDTAVRSYSESKVGALAEADAILLSEPLALRLKARTGEILSVRLGGQARKLRIQGILPSRGVGEAYGGEIGVMEVRSLQTILGREGWLDRIDVVLSPGSSKAKVIEAIRSKLGDRATVCRAAGRDAWVETSLLMVRIIVSALIGIASVVASLVSYGALSWFVDRLTPELALLKVAGLEPRRLKRLLYIDAGLLATLGTGVGMVSGRLLSESFLAGLSWLTTFIQGVELQHLTFRASTLATGAIVGGSVSVAGVLGPARRASRLLPLDAAHGVECLTEARVERAQRHIWAMGFIIVGCFTAALPTVPPIARVTAILAAGLTLLGISAHIALPVALEHSRCLLDKVLPGMGRLVGIGLLSRPNRTALTITCVAAVTAGITMSLTLTRSAARTLDAWLEKEFRGGVFVTTDNVFSTQPAEAILPETVAAIRQTPNVKAVFEEVSEEIVYQDEEALLVAGSMRILAQYGQLQVVGGSSRAVAEALLNGEIAISESFARHFGTHQGDFITLSTPRGARNFRVAGIIRDYAGPTGSLNVDIGVFDQLWPRQGSRDVVFWTDGEPALLIPGIRSRLAGRQPLLFSYGESLSHFASHQMMRLRGVLASVALMTALLGAVAISSLMLSNVTIQTRNHALLAAAGATGGQIRVMILLEGLFLGLSGGVAGIALGVSASYPIVMKVLPDGIGWTLAFSTDPTDLLLLITCVAASAVLASAYPAWIASDISIRDLSVE